MTSILDKTLFNLGGNPVHFSQVIVSCFVLIGLVLFYRMTRTRLKEEFDTKIYIQKEGRSRFFLLLGLLLVAFLAYFLVFMLNSNHTLGTLKSIPYTYGYLIEIGIIITLAMMFLWLSNNLSMVIGGLEKSETNHLRIANNFRYIIVLGTIYILLQKSNLDPILFETEVKGNHIIFKLGRLIVAVIILLLARIISLFAVTVFLVAKQKNDDIDPGAQFALTKIVTYVIYVLAVLFALQYLGIQMTLIWGGAAALLVGVGLGLQQTFNDFFSGVLLLFERTIKVGDILSMEGNRTGRVMKIGLRTSILKVRDNTNIVVPNSQLVNNQITNWTLNNKDNYVRFQIDITVAYGSDTKLVKKLLIKAAKQNVYILSVPSPFVRFIDFGDNALHFSLFFFSSNYIIIEDIKSDIRFIVDQNFRDHDIKIPFPQREIWVNK